MIIANSKYIYQATCDISYKLDIIKGVAPSVLDKKVSIDVINRHRTGQTGTGQVRHAL